MFETEHGHTHGHKTGLPWLDIVVTLSVVAISVMSLVVSIYHGRTMEKLVHENERMVAADTLPYLTFYMSDFDLEANRKRGRRELKNAGIGPALINWYELRWRGRAYDTPRDLIRACCAPDAGPDHPSGIADGNASGVMLPAKEKIDLLLDVDADPTVAAAFERALPEMSARACYCSVLDQCWVTDFGRERPKPVKDCRVPPGVKLW